MDNFAMCVCCTARVFVSPGEATLMPDGEQLCVCEPCVKELANGTSFQEMHVLSARQSAQPLQKGVEQMGVRDGPGNLQSEVPAHRAAQ